MLLLFNIGAFINKIDMFKRFLSALLSLAVVFGVSGISVYAEDPVTLTEFTVVASNGGNLDPAPDAGDEDLEITYGFSAPMDGVNIKIENPYGDLVDQFFADTAKLQNGTFIWNGREDNEIVEPGIYTVSLSAQKSGQDDIKESKTITVFYGDSKKANIDGLQVIPDSFDPDFEDAQIEFSIDEDAELTVEIRKKSNDDVIRVYTDYLDDDYDSDSDHEISWDGKNNAGDIVDQGDYYVIVIARNDYGVSVEKEDILVTNTSGSVKESNAHIKDIDLSPSSKFNPAEDDELVIEFDIEKDLDELRIVAVKGSDEVELFDDEDVDEENNVEVTWDGTDDDGDYVSEGSWKILFKSQVGSTELLAQDSIKIEYEEPKIEEFLLSKNKIDNELDEFTYILFKVDQDAEITLEVLLDNDVDDEIEEDMAVEKDVWYAVEWDGDSYDYDDDIDIRILASNEANEDINDSEKVSLILDEDDVPSTRANVTNDYIEPVISDGNEALEIFFELDEDAEVTISIHKGKNTTSSKVIELVTEEEFEDGEHSLVWNGRDLYGNKLSKGFYTYKITSEKVGSDTETGVFVIGDVGEIEGGSATDDDDDDVKVVNGKISSNVVSVDGKDVDEDEPKQDNDDDDDDSLSGNCGGFWDVSSSYQYCDAIEWAKQQGIFSGYPDGSFKPNQAINRAEVLKSILKATGIGVDTSSYGNLGFSDVQAGAWYVPYLAKAKALGIIHGDKGKNTVRPADYVNRAELLKFVFESLEISTGYQVSSCQSFSDVSSGNWYYDYACAADQLNIYYGDALYPETLISRGEVVQVLYILHFSNLL